MNPKIKSFFFLVFHLTYRSLFFLHKVLKYLDYVQLLQNDSPSKGHNVLQMVPKLMRE